MKLGTSQTPAVHKEALNPGLYIVATPIGNLRDITLRALTVLTSAHAVYCEDTRTSGKLMHHFGLKAPLDAYHEHNAARKRPEILARLGRGEAVALISDAGTPLISDPGYKLVREAVEAGHAVIPLPGASSVMAALCVSALPTDRFFFAGFLPSKEAALRKELSALAAIPATLVFFESPRRLRDTLAIMQDVLGDRLATVCRELTKLHEELARGTLSQLAAHFAVEPKGEIVLVVAPPLETVVDAGALDEVLGKLLAAHSLKDTVALACAQLNLPRSEVYARALALKEEK